jgi:lysylphosphatidylglycerol synthase-like protein
MRRSGLTVVASIGASIALVVVLVGKWDELEAGITGAAASVIALAVALQVVALVSRSEAWRVCVHASGGTVSRRRLYRASSFGCVGQLLNSQLGTAARIAALRRSAPEECPRVPSLVAAELPILFVEAALAALTSFTLVGPLGLPWWTPILCVAAVGAVGLVFRNIAAAKARWLRKGLSVLRSQRGSTRLVGFVLIAVFAQIGRNWLLLHAVGVDASVFDAIAVLIAVVSLGQLPFGLSVGAAAAVLILGPQGVAAATAAGVLLTATGTVGGLAFAAWAALDLLSLRLLIPRAAGSPWSALAALPIAHRRAIEGCYFGGLSHLQITRVLGVSPA